MIGMRRRVVRPYCHAYRLIRGGLNGTHVRAIIGIGEREQTIMTQPNQFERLVRRAVLCCTALLVAAPTWAAEPSPVILVEEHWELHIGQPDPGRNAPQATMVMSPSGDLDGAYFLFTLNHETAPDYRPGGVQTQHWDGTSLVDYRSETDDEGEVLAQSDEVIRWVQRLTVNDGALTFQIANGWSDTWRNFGGDDLTLSTPTTLVGLNGYLPSVSLTESEVGYADNRVGSLVLKKLVWVRADGTVHEQNAPIPIDTTLDP
jgi:hypothetical protein